MPHCTELCFLSLFCSMVVPQSSLSSYIHTDVSDSNPTLQGSFEPPPSLTCNFSDSEKIGSQHPQYIYLFVQP